jgi:preprotein translocase subunit SecG
MQALIIVIHIIAAVAIIILVLLQHGKGADVGAAFGSGASNTMFGSTGAMSFFMKLTVLFAAIFFATSLSLSYLASHRHHRALAFPGPQTPSVNTLPGYQSQPPASQNPPAPNHQPTQNSAPVPGKNG